MKKYGNIALVLSIVIHISFFAGAVSVFKKRKIVEYKTRDLEIISQEPRQEADNLQENVFPDLEEITAPAPPYIDNVVEKIIAKRDQKLALTKPQIIDKSIKEEAFSQEESVSIPKELFFSQDLEKIPAYMDYYQAVREKIRRTARQYYDSSEKGRVFLSFIILPDGKLQDVHLRRESGISNNLINNALKSVKNASPFPEFPKELKNYPYLQFNLPIYFKNN